MRKINDIRHEPGLDVVQQVVVGVAQAFHADVAVGEFCFPFRLRVMLQCLKVSENLGRPEDRLGGEDTLPVLYNFLTMKLLE